MQEQANNKNLDLDIDQSAESRQAMSPEEHAQLEVLQNKANKEKEVLGGIQSETGGSRRDTQLSAQDMLDATAINRVDPKIMNPDRSPEAKILQRSLEMLQGDHKLDEEHAADFVDALMSVQDSEPTDSLS